MVFLVSVEANIAVTSLVAISHDLGGFEIVTWILSSYQLGFVCQSDIFYSPLPESMVTLYLSGLH